MVVKLIESENNQIQREIYLPGLIVFLLDIFEQLFQI